MKKVISIRAPFTLCRSVCCFLYWEQKKEGQVEKKRGRERKASSRVWWKLTKFISILLMNMLSLTGTSVGDRTGCQGSNQHLVLTSNLITAHKHNAEGFIPPNSLLLRHPSLQMFHFYCHSNKHGSNLLQHDSGRLQAATCLSYVLLSCLGWGCCV